MVAYLGEHLAPCLERPDPSPDAPLMNALARGVLAGDIDPETALPVLEKALGGLEPAALEPPSPGDLRGPEGRTQHDVEGEGEQKVLLGWRLVDANHADEPALEIMDAIIDNSETGLLNLELELSQKLPSV